MVKFAIIGAYVAHKVYWKRKYKERSVRWNTFFKKVDA